MDSNKCEITDSQTQMGKSNNTGQIKCVWSTAKKISKPEKPNDIVHHYSTHNILNSPGTRQEDILTHVKRALEKLLKLGNEQNKRRIMSVLNVNHDQEQPHQKENIPSIEDFLESTQSLTSKKDNEENNIFSDIFMIESVPFLRESQPELMLNFVYLVEKATKNLNYIFSSTQNQILMLGIWNILLKYWSDHPSQQHYPTLGAEIEWGILQLLKFDIKMSKKDRVLFEAQIKSLTFLQN